MLHQIFIINATQTSSQAHGTQYNSHVRKIRQKNPSEKSVRKIRQKNPSENSIRKISEKNNVCKDVYNEVVWAAQSVRKKLSVDKSLDSRKKLKFWIEVEKGGRDDKASFWELDDDQDGRIVQKKTRFLD